MSMRTWSERYAAARWSSGSPRTTSYSRGKPTEARRMERVRLRVVASGDDRARVIRDHLLPLVRERGALEVQRDAVRLTELRTGPWIFRHWTPFNELLPGEASSPGYRRAVERQ